MLAPNMSVWPSVFGGRFNLADFLVLAGVED